ncbi:membrane protein containing DUF1558 [Rhodopirellula europaea SH398]|uniref:Membrane protein containing DUF1558 n=1 Tax=Rhodopirellula europaea SH398 TaxID=1263868 RepID=M5SJP6_9BACT|nr:membrane protein containing DUF1558 [Rhodopirellula europaea SH398]
MARESPGPLSSVLSDTAPDSDPAADPVQSYARPPEQPLFARVRTWTDVMPWLRLVNVVRLAGAPVWLLLVAIVDVVWRFGLARIAAHHQSPIEATEGWRTTASLGDLVAVGPWSLLDPLRAPDGSFLREPFWEATLWTIVLWTPVAMVLLRLGVLLTAGRDLPGFVETWKIIGKQLKSAIVISVLPAVCALPLLLFLWFADGIATAERAHSEWSYVFAPLAIAAGLVVGLLLAGAKAAIPFGLAALVSQEKADAMDCLSRGYEVTFRRLPQLVLLAVPALVLLMIVVGGWHLVGLTAVSTMRNPVWNAFVSRFPTIVGITVGWALVGGVYLLLRQSAGGQEVEDVWDGPKAKSLEIPSVKRDAKRG